MGRKVTAKIYVHRSDLWPGATDDDVLPVVESLQRQGREAFRVSAAGQSTVGDCLKFAADYYEFALASLTSAVERAERDANDKVVKELIRERAKLERAQAERHRFQVEVEALEARLDALATASEAFDKAVKESHANDR